MNARTHPRPNYAAVFFALLVLTLLEIFAANLAISKIVVIFILLSLAIVKAALVAMFYMHLRFEKVLLAVIAFAPLIFSVILTVLVGSDIGHPRI